MDRSDVVVPVAWVVGGALLAYGFRQMPITGTLISLSAAIVTPLAIKAERHRSATKVSSLIAGSYSLLFLGATFGLFGSSLATLKEGIGVRRFRTVFWGATKLIASPFLSIPTIPLLNASRALWNGEWWPCDGEGWDADIFLIRTNKGRQERLEKPYHAQDGFKGKMEEALKQKNETSLQSLASEDWQWTKFWSGLEEEAGRCKGSERLSKKVEDIRGLKDPEGQLKAINALAREVYLNPPSEELLQVKQVVEPIEFWQGRAAIDRFVKACPAEVVEPKALLKELFPDAEDGFEDFIAYTLSNEIKYEEWGKKLGLVGDCSNNTAFYTALNSKMKAVGLFTPDHVRMYPIVPKGWDPFEPSDAVHLEGINLTTYVLGKLEEHFKQLDSVK
ncbi:MAG: hypothetical protein AB7F31_00105 [Parachlamydiales bacterium]